MGAFVQRGDPFCLFFPGDIPGVNVFFETRGQVVITPSGQFHLTCHGDLPAGYSVSRAVQIDLPCESPGFPNARGQIVVTPSGRVNAVCQASL